jgi:hypothetical protein
MEFMKSLMRQASCWGVAFSFENKSREWRRYCGKDCWRRRLGRDLHHGAIFRIRHRGSIFDIGSLSAYTHDEKCRYRYDAEL